MGCRVQRHAQPAADLEAGHHGGQQFLAGCAGNLGGGKGCGHYRGAGVQRTVGMRVVEIKRMAQRAVQKRRRCGAITAVEPEDGAGPAPLHSQPRQHRQNRGGRVSLLRRADAGAHQIADERQRAGHDLGRNVCRGGFSGEAGKLLCGAHRSLVCRFWRHPCRWAAGMKAYQCRRRHGEKEWTAT